MSATTKGNLKRLPIEHFMVSSSEVTKYLQDQLGFPFDCDFQLCDMRGDFEKPMATEKCYVIMRVVFRPEDIQMIEPTSTYVDKVLVDAAAGMRFKDNVMETLKPFMFPADFQERLNKHPEFVTQLARQGVFGERLEKLIRRPGIFYDTTNRYFGVYLRPEEIIKDMCADPATNKVNGVVAFGYVDGVSNNASAITWGVNVYHNKTIALKGVDIDSVFNNAGVQV